MHRTLWMSRYCRLSRITMVVGRFMFHPYVIHSLPWQHLLYKVPTVEVTWPDWPTLAVISKGQIPYFFSIVHPLPLFNTNQLPSTSSTPSSTASNCWLQSAVNLVLAVERPLIYVSCSVFQPSGGVVAILLCTSLAWRTLHSFFHHRHASSVVTHLD